MCPFYGGVAQLGERLNGIQEVKSSILSVSTKKPFTSSGRFLLYLGKIFNSADGSLAFYLLDFMVDCVLELFKTF